MTPGAQVAAAIAVLDSILSGAPAEQALTRWARASRFAGSSDRAAVRDIVFDVLRRRDSYALLGGGCSGRALLLGRCRALGQPPETVFTGEGHAPPVPAGDELQSPPREAAATAADPMTDIPRWLHAAWCDSLGDRAGPVAQAMRDRAPVWLRANLRRTSVPAVVADLAADGIAATPDPRLAGALRVTRGERRVAASAAYRAGLVELQDLSPQLACAAVPVRDGAAVLDFCAGGGGKALALAARARLSLTAHDALPQRMADLPARAARAGVEMRLSPPARLAEGYDVVVADVPCSGSGTWRRTPDAKWRLNADSLARLIDTQAGILRDAAALTRPGGVLAYMTCSVLDAENARQVEAFLASRPDWRSEAEHLYTPVAESDGFYLRLLRREAIGD